MSIQYRGRGISLDYTKKSDPLADDFELHVHRQYEVLCFVSGNVSYLVEGREYELHSGCIMIMRPAELHKLVVKGKGEYERFVFHFDGEIVGKMGMTDSMLSAFNNRELGEKNRYLAGELGGFDTVGFFKQLFEECSADDPEQTILANLGCLLCAIRYAFLKNDSADTLPSDGFGRELIAYVNENLTEPISLRSVSEHTHMSPSQVNRIFKSLTGTSVYDYVLSKRLIMARELIAKGEGAVSASQKCGFGDYSSFYRLYKKRIGRAPTENKRRE